MSRPLADQFECLSPRCAQPNRHCSLLAPQPRMAAAPGRPVEPRSHGFRPLRAATGGAFAPSRPSAGPSELLVSQFPLVLGFSRFPFAARLPPSATALIGAHYSGRSLNCSTHSKHSSVRSARPKSVVLALQRHLPRWPHSLCALSGLIVFHGSPAASQGLRIAVVSFPLRLARLPHPPTPRLPQALRWPVLLLAAPSLLGVLGQSVGDLALCSGPHITPDRIHPSCSRFCGHWLACTFNFSAHPLPRLPLGA